MKPDRHVLIFIKKAVNNSMFKMTLFGASLFLLSCSGAKSQGFDDSFDSIAQAIETEAPVERLKRHDRW